MKITFIILSFICLALVCTSAYSQDMKGYWQSRSLSDSTMRGYQHSPRTSIFPNRSSKYSTEYHNTHPNSQVKQYKWQHNPIHLQRNPHREKSSRSNRWDRRWHKNKWRKWPAYWRGYDLRYKSVLDESDISERTQKIIKWVPTDTKVEKAPKTEPKKTYAKPKIVTINDTADTSSETAGEQSESADQSIEIYDGRNKIKVNNKVKKRVHVTKAGVVEIFSSEKTKE